jgi:hypothetical protein
VEEHELVSEVLMRQIVSERSLENSLSTDDTEETEENLSFGLRRYLK